MKIDKNTHEFQKSHNDCNEPESEITFKRSIAVATVVLILIFGMWYFLGWLESVIVRAPIEYIIVGLLIAAAVLIAIIYKYLNPYE